HINLDANIDIVFISSKMHDVLGNENTVPEKSLILGTLKVIKQELPNIKCYNYDLELTEELSQRHIEPLLNYISDKNQKYTDVSYRNGRIWIQKYSAIKLFYNENCLLKQGGVYVITGGLGKIGLQIAKDITAKYNATAILIQRGKFP